MANSTDQFIRLEPQVAAAGADGDDPEKPTPWNPTEEFGTTRLKYLKYREKYKKQTVFPTQPMLSLLALLVSSVA